MESLEARLMVAVKKSDAMQVQSLILKGANVNVVTATSRTPLGIAATIGNIAILKILLNTCGRLAEASKTFSAAEQRDLKKSRSVSKNTYPKLISGHCAKKNDCGKCHHNLGYFVIIHDDTEGELISETQQESIGFGHSVAVREEDISKNSDLTPEGMERLEWDMEVNQNEIVEEEDIWALQYRWYARILDKTCSILIDKGPKTCDVNLQDATGRCAIHYAADQGNLDTVKLLLQYGCRVDIGDADNLTALHLAAARDNVEVARLLLRCGARVNSKTSDKMSALHFACARGYTDMACLLLEAGARVDALDSSDRTALLLAVSRGQAEVARLLVDRGAKINIEEIHGYTPLCEAVWQNCVELVELLLGAGAKLTQSHRLLQHAILHRHTDMALKLIDAGSIINLRDDNGDTPLLLATRTAHFPMVQLLLQRGASANYGNSLTGSTPLHEAVESVRDSDLATLQSIVGELRQHGADLNTLSWSGGETPLTRALLVKRYRAGAYLITLGADVNRADSAPHCPFNNLAIARSRLNYSLVQLLVYAGYDLQKKTADLLPPSDFSELDLNSIDGWLKFTKFNPMKLTDLCRIQLRRHLLDHVCEVVERLDVPKCVKKFIMLNDIYNEDLIIVKPHCKKS